MSNDNEIVIKNEEEDAKYFILFEAVKKCEYSITARTVELSLSRLERGKQALIKLKKGEVGYYLLKNRGKSFKIISMLKYGDTQLYINRTNPEEGLFNLTDHYKSFKQKSPHQNTLYMDSSSPDYC